MKRRKPKLTPEREGWFRTKTEQAFKERPHLRKLHRRLLKIGGAAVVLWNGTNGEEITAALLKLGSIDNGREAILRLGNPSDCHENSARLHQQEPQRYEVRTGYALSEDGIWRPHSWVFDANTDDIIETTEARVTYFGFVEVGRKPS
jgi:hypothetical protein